MSAIKNIKAREILDSRGNPTIEVTVFTDSFIGVAAVPSGASTGRHEAKELRDGGKRYNGLGVKKAITAVEKRILPILKGLDCTRQQEIDRLMIEKDGTKNKSKLGANAMLAVSLVCARIGAQINNIYLYEHINELLMSTGDIGMPRPFFNILNGGVHADSKLGIQEFMISPNFNTVQENIRVASEVYRTLKQILHKKFGKSSTNVGDEGGFVPAQLNTTAEALELIQKAINAAGHKFRVNIALDCAASEFYKNGKYKLDGKTFSKENLLKYYLQLIKKYNLISIEDPFQQEDFKSFAKLKEKSEINVVGDDLTVTNVTRIKKADKSKSCNCLLLKVNQIGTLSEALEAAKLARKNGWEIMVSHRSGETEDTFIADLAVGIAAEQIKAGAPSRGERTAKYNQLIRIEESLEDV